MLGRTKKIFNPTEYLAMEEVADYKSEYFNGEIFAMSGGTPDHSSVAVNIATELNRLLAQDLVASSTAICVCTSTATACTPIRT